MVITGYETIKSRASYSLSFELDGKHFDWRLTESMSIEDPSEVLNLVYSIQKMNLNPIISRLIIYDSTKSGYLTKDPENQELTVERLEEIVRNRESLPVHQEPIIESTYRC